MTYHLLILGAGFAGSFHCIGMCGGFACALGRDPRGRLPTILRHLLYNGGRASTYCFLGGLAGSLGKALCLSPGSAGPLMDLGVLDIGQRLLALVAGTLMIVMALQFFGVSHRFHRRHGAGGGSVLATSLRSLLGSHGRGAPLALGVFNGFLPCPLVYAFLAQAAATAGALSGVLTMAAFSLGTFPAMLFMGSVGPLLGRAGRQRMVWLSGSLILVVGIITLGRGLLPSTMHMGHGLGYGLGPAT